MRIAVIGAGPAGLGAAVSLKHAVGDRAELTVYDRGGSGPDGFGLILSPRTVARYSTMGFAWAAQVSPELVSWNELAVIASDESVPVAGHPARAIARTRLIEAMRGEANRLGCRLVDGDEVNEAQVAAAADGVIDARGARHERLPLSAIGAGEYADEHADEAHFVWYATDRMFPRLTFVFADSGAGVLTAHAYPYAPDRTAFIVEGPARAWQAALDRQGRAIPGSAAGGAGPSIDAMRLRSAVRTTFAHVLTGHRLYGTPSGLRTFRVRSTPKWRTGKTVLIGDAAHSAHFSVGSGTSMALDDALTLAAQLRDAPDMAEGMDSYAALRRPETGRVQELGRRSAAWWASLPVRWPVLSEPELAWSLVTRTGQGTASRLRAANGALHTALVQRAGRRPHVPVRPARRVWRFPDDESLLRNIEPDESVEIAVGELDGTARVRLVDLLERIVEHDVLRGRRGVGLRVRPADADWAEAQRLAGRVSAVLSGPGEDER